MNEDSKQIIIENYRNLFLKHHSGPAVGQWSAEGQRFRFEKLAQIADLRDTCVLDVGCGLGDLYPFLMGRFGRVNYAGVDIVPELIASAAEKHPSARFLCHDLLVDKITETFNYALISGVFNNAIPQCTDLLKEMLNAVFQQCRHGLAFSFTSVHVNSIDAGMAYHDPIDKTSMDRVFTTKWRCLNV